jgi:hypothetical protein
MRILIVAILLILSATPVRATDVTLGGSTYTLNAHPRLLVGGHRTLAAMQADMVAGNRFWTEMIATATADRGTYPDYSGMTPSNVLKESMIKFGLLYALDQTAYADFGAAAKEIMLTHVGVTPSTYSDTDTVREHIVGIAKTYDFIYPLLTTQDKADINTQVNDVMYPFALTGHSLTSNWHNLYVTQFHTEILYGLATFEDNEISDAIGISGNSSEQMLLDGFSDYTGYRANYADSALIGGHTFSGTSYGSQRIWVFLTQILESLYSSCGLDQWSGATWVDDIVEFAIHTTLPGESILMYPDGNVGDDGWGYRRIESLGLITNYLGESDTLTHQFRYWFNNVYGGDSQLLNSFYQQRTFMWFDPDWATEVDYTSTFPTAYASTGVGLYQARTSWTDTATFLSFSSATYLADHQGTDSGSFKLFRDGEWLIYENGDSGNGMGVDTNMIWLDDGVVNYSWANYPITGGKFSTSGTQDTTATIDRNSSTNSYNYAKGDVTNSYIDARYNTSGPKDFYKLDYYSKSFVQLKGSGVIVMYDNIDSATGYGSVDGIVDGSTVDKKMLLHLANNPAISGNTFTLTMTRSKLTAKILLPANVEILATDVTDKTTSVAGDDVYQLTVETTDAAQDYDPFLTVFKAGDTTIAAPAATLISGTGGVGALVDNTAVMFTNSASGADISTLTYDSNGATDHIIADLPVSTSVSVTYNGSEIAVSPITSDSGGTIEFATASTNAEIIVTASTPTTEISCTDLADNDGDGDTDCDDSDCVADAACIASPTCSDGIMNGDETDVDCGGSCAACESEPTGTGHYRPVFSGGLFTPTVGGLVPVLSR